MTGPMTIKCLTGMPTCATCKEVGTDECTYWTEEMMKTKAVKAILFTNGVLMVFNNEGKQMQDYQGIGSEMLPKLRQDFPDCPVSGMDWNTDVRPGL